MIKLVFTLGLVLLIAFLIRKEVVGTDYFEIVYLCLGQVSLQYHSLGKYCCLVCGFCSDKLQEIKLLNDLPKSLSQYQHQLLLVLMYSSAGCLCGRNSTFFRSLFSIPCYLLAPKQNSGQILPLLRFVTFNVQKYEFVQFGTLCLQS